MYRVTFLRDLRDGHQNRLIGSHARFRPADALFRDAQRVLRLRRLPRQRNGALTARVAAVTTPGDRLGVTERSTPHREVNPSSDAVVPNWKDVLPDLAAVRLSADPQRLGAASGIRLRGSAGDRRLRRSRRHLRRSLRQNPQADARPSGVVCRGGGDRHFRLATQPLVPSLVRQFVSMHPR